MVLLLRGGDTNLVQLDSVRDLYKANNKKKIQDDTAIKEAVVNIKKKILRKN